VTTLDELLKIDGVAAVGEFQPDGTLVEYKSAVEMTQELATMSAQFCASVSMLFGTLSGAFTQVSGMNWSPPQGWMFAGGIHCSSPSAIAARRAAKALSR